MGDDGTHKVTEDIRKQMDTHLELLQHTISVYGVCLQLMERLFFRIVLSRFLVCHWTYNLETWLRKLCLGIRGNPDSQKGH